MRPQAHSNPQAAVEAMNHVRAAHIAALNEGDVNAWVAAFTHDGVHGWQAGTPGATRWQMRRNALVQAGHPGRP